MPTAAPTTPGPATTHRLEGPDLDALLAQVSAELGPQAVIVEANKLRTGGVGGFFAKEGFEVVVTVPSGESRPAAGIDALVEAASAGDVAPSAPAASGTSVPRMSTETVGFAGVLDRMVRDVGMELGAPRPVGPAATAEPGGAPADDAAPFEPLRPAEVAPLAAPGPVASTAPLDAPEAPGASRAVLDQRWLARVGVPPGIATYLGPPCGEPAGELLRLMEQVPRPPALPRQQGAVIAVAGGRAPALRTAELLAGELGVDAADVLVAAETFRGGAVAQDRRLARVEVAAEQRRSWRRRRTPTIVVVDAAVGRVRSSWALEIVDALEPTMVWGVVEAVRKPEDIRCWAERLGGLDALAVTDLDQTVSPATVLAVGVPVGLLDGQPATAARWTALLADQLELAA